MAINFSAVFLSVTDQKQHKVRNQDVDPGESVIYKKPIVLSASFFFCQTRFISNISRRHIENQVFQAEVEMFH